MFIIFHSGIMIEVTLEIHWRVLSRAGCASEILFSQLLFRYFFLHFINISSLFYYHKTRPAPHCYYIIIFAIVNAEDMSWTYLWQGSVVQAALSETSLLK